jgi:hypothetical protein
MTPKIAVLALSLVTLTALGCKTTEEARLGANAALDAGHAEVELPLSTSRIPLVGARISVTRTAVYVGEENKRVAALRSLGPRPDAPEIVALEDELLSRFPRSLSERPMAQLFVDRRTTFDILTRIAATITAASLGRIRFAGAGNGRVDELFPASGIDSHQPLLVAVQGGAAFLERDLRHCQGDFPAPNVRSITSAPDGDVMRLKIDMGLSYSVAVRAAGSTRFGEIATVLDALSHVVHFGTIGFCYDPRDLDATAQ